MADSTKNPVCKYGDKCYQKNPVHRSKYRHPVQPTLIPPTKQQTQDAADDDVVNTQSTNSDERVTTRRRARSPTNSPSDVSDRKKISRSRSPSASRKESYNLRSPRTANKNGSIEEINLSPPVDQVSQQCRRNKSPRISGADGSSASSYASLSSGPSPDKDIDFINDCFDKETRFSQRAEYKEMLKDYGVFIRNKFLVEMPIDFYKFWDFCKENVKKDQKPETLFDKFGLTLLGPFDVLAGKFDPLQTRV